MSTAEAPILELLKQKETQERNRRCAKAEDLRRRLAQVEAQTEQLRTYQRHYQDHWQLQFKSGASVQVLQYYQQFVERLDAALAQQAHTIRHVSALAEQAQADLVQQDIRVAGIDKLIERRAQQEQREEQRREQRSDDEWAQRASRSRAPALSAL
jgi:flagellar FliJ protein